MTIQTQKMHTYSRSRNTMIHGIHMRSRSVLTHIVLPLLCAVCLTLPASATTHFVTTLIDEDNGSLIDTAGGGAGTSLRECIAYSAAGDTVRFDPSVIPGTVFLSLGTLTVSHDLTLIGPGSANAGLSGSGNTQIFHIAGGVTFHLQSLTLFDGYAVAGAVARAVGTLHMANCLVRDNASLQDGGAVFLDGAAGTFFNVHFLRNAAYGSGGAISTTTLAATMLSVDSCHFESNVSNGNGGAIAASGPVAVTLLRSILLRNTAAFDGGGVSIGNGASVAVVRTTLDNNNASRNGGGLHVSGALPATGTVLGSTFSANKAAGSGGAIALQHASGSVTLTSSTISGNLATYGGGVAQTSTGTTTNTFCTIAENSGVNGGGYYVTGSTATFSATLLGNNTAASGPDVSGSVTSSGRNLVARPIGSSGWVGTDIVGTDTTQLVAGIEPLQNNGGLTKTHALQACSPAVDATAINSGAIITDQRGLPRFRDGDNNSSAIADIGAYEAQTSIDVTAPIAVCKPFTAALDASGVARARVIDINAGSVDNCGIVSYTLSDSLWNCTQTGVHQVTLTVRDKSNNVATCIAQVTVVDLMKPTVTPPAAVVVNAATGTCAWTVVPGTLGTATGSDNCGSVTISSDAPASLSVGTHLITWTATDGSSNTASATQLVTVNDTQNPTIIAPAPVTVSPTGGACSIAASLVLLGAPVAADNCGSVAVSNNAPSVYPVGTTVVTWTAVDAAGNSATALQNVVVTDNTKPTITAPSALDVATNVGSCTRSLASLTLGSPTVGDNCPGSLTLGNNAPAQFPIGTTVVTWTVTDAGGNSASATQSVTVRDDLFPVITAPASLTVAAPAGTCSIPAASLSLGTPTVSDNCGVGTPTSDAPTIFPVGITQVIWKVFDTYGNMSTAAQLVTVTSGTPTISCPSPIVVSTANGRPGAVVTYTPPTGGSDCPGTETIRIAGLGSGSFFPIGTTTESYLVTDAIGRTATCSFTITVNDTEAPTIAVALSPVNLWPGDNTMRTVRAVVTAADNAPGVVWSLTSITANQGTSGDIDGALFGTADNEFLLRAKRSGNLDRTYTVTYTATDASLNTSSATATVVVPSSRPKDLIVSDETAIPAVATLDQNFPNPFNPTTTIRFGLPAESHARLTIFNSVGHVVAVLFDRSLPAGQHSLMWDGTDGSGRRVSSGMYLYRLEAAGGVTTRRMLLLQ